MFINLNKNIVNTTTILNKKRFKKKKFKKLFFLNKLYSYVHNIIFKTQHINLYLYKIHVKNSINNNTIININQKNVNTKTGIFIKKNLNTFSIGSIIKYFNIKQGKSIRRSNKGTKIFFNFLKNVLEKKYYNYNTVQNNLLLQINGFDYNFFFIKNFFKNFFKKNPFEEKFFLLNMLVCFSKKKVKKKKSIKKRLKKSILINSLKLYKI